MAMRIRRYNAKHIAQKGRSRANLDALDAATRQVFAPYRPIGRHGHRFCSFAAGRWSSSDSGPCCRRRPSRDDDSDDNSDDGSGRIAEEADVVICRRRQSSSPSPTLTIPPPC